MTVQADLDLIGKALTRLWQSPSLELSRVGRQSLDAHDRLSRLLQEQEKALRQADADASVAHDAIWSREVASASILHDNDRSDSAQSAIWRLHSVVRAALSAGEPGGEKA